MRIGYYCRKECRILRTAFPCETCNDEFGSCYPDYDIEPDFSDMDDDVNGVDNLSADEYEALLAREEEEEKKNQYYPDYYSDDIPF